MVVREDARPDAEALEELEENATDYNKFVRVWVDVGGALETFEINNVDSVNWRGGTVNVFLEDDADEWEGLDERRRYYHFDRDRVVGVKFIDSAPSSSTC